ELVSLQQLYPSATILRGDSATPARVLGALSRVAVLHFAGHARSSPQGAYGSRLYLAGDSGEAGVLESTSIARLDLSGLRLVVLSACETMMPLAPDTYR